MDPYRNSSSNEKMVDAGITTVTVRLKEAIDGETKYEIIFYGDYVNPGGYPNTERAFIEHSSSKAMKWVQNNSLQKVVLINNSSKKLVYTNIDNIFAIKCETTENLIIECLTMGDVKKSYVVNQENIIQKKPPPPRV